MHKSNDETLQGLHGRLTPGRPRTETSLPLRMALALGASAAVSALMALSCTSTAHHSISVTPPHVIASPPAISPYPTYDFALNGHGVAH